MKYEYITRFKQNDYARFEEFYKATSKGVYFVSLGILKDTAKAEDIVQETYITFLEHIDDYKEGGSVSAYLAAIARNKSINLYNREKRVTLGDEQFENIPAEEENNEGAEAILQLLENREEREIVTYHVLCGYKFKDIAKLMDEPLGTVLWRYQKAMKTLRKKVVGT